MWQLLRREISGRIYLRLPVVMLFGRRRCWQRGCVHPTVTKKNDSKDKDILKKGELRTRKLQRQTEFTKNDLLQSFLENPLACRLQKSLDSLLHGSFQLCFCGIDNSTRNKQFRYMEQWKMLTKGQVDGRLDRWTDKVTCMYICMYVYDIAAYTKS